MKYAPLKILILFFPLLLLAAPRATAQRFHFDQYVNGNKVGELTASRSQQGEQTVFRIRSQVEAQVVFAIDVRFELESVFQQGILQHSEVKIYRNDKLKEHALTRREGNRYRLTHDGKTSWLDHPGIQETSATIYFEEPLGTSSVFSEQYGNFSPLRREKPGVYRMSPPSKNQDNVYHYREERLAEVEVGHWLATIMFKARSEEGVTASGGN